LLRGAACNIYDADNILLRRTRPGNVALNPDFAQDYSRCNIYNLVMGSRLDSSDWTLCNVGGNIHALFGGKDADLDSSELHRMVGLPRGKY
jgi:hypothetical protein